MTNVYRAKFVVEMEAAGERFEVSQFAGDWGTSDVPTARCVLAVGRNAADGITEAAIHSKLNDLKEFVTAKVFFSATGQWDENNEWPAGEHLIFEGKIQGIGIQKINEKLTLVAYIRHWIGDLNMASAVSSLFHPSNPAEYTYQAVLSPLFEAGAPGNSPVGIGGSSLSEVITAANITDDLWGRVIKPMMCSLAEQDTIVLNPDLASCFELDPEIGPAEDVKEALRRIEGVSPDSDCSSPLSCWTPKLALDLADGSVTVPLTVADAIAKAIMDDTVSSFTSNTLWAKLLYYASVFSFDVIPLVDSALVVPKSYGLRTTWCKKIKASDYVSIGLNSGIEQPIRGLAVASSGIQRHTGIFGETGFPGVGGCYEPDPVPNEGMIHFTRAPSWLENIMISGHSPSRTTGVKNSIPVSTATTPQADPKDELVGNKDGKARIEILRDLNDLYDSYARSIYVANVLRTRSGQLSGKLRFDISPGSVVEIEGTSGQFLNEEDNLAKTLYGTVYRVAIAINAETSKAGTSFRVRDIRTAEENQDDAMSTENHPLYTTIFRGAPIVEDLLMPEPGDDCCLE